MFKTKDEYCHIYDDKLIISKTPEIDDLVGDYGKSINNVFKTLMVFLVSIPIFTALSFIFYNLDKIGLAINTGVFGLFFLIMAFYIMLFTSGTPLIKRENIHKIKFQSRIFNVLVITYKEFGRHKKRHLIIEDNQIDNIKDLLLSEKLIENKDIELKGNKVAIFTYIIAFIIIVPSYTLLMRQANNNVQTILTNFSGIIVGISSILLIIMIRKLIKPLFYSKTTNR